VLVNEFLLIVQSLFPKDLKLLENLKDINIKNSLSKKDLQQIIQNPIKAKNILDYYNKTFVELEKKIKQSGIKLLFVYETNYPILLKRGYAPPAAIFYKGDISTLNSKTISIVGTRKPTLYGRKYAGFFSEDLANFGITVVSGMARGIDTEAHKGALRKGKTIAVLGSNLEKIYPASNRNLFYKIIENGCAISEFSPLYPTLSSNFPVRNRIIAYLSPLTFVIEARQKSGSLITAYLANDAGRDVAALPADINKQTSEGTNHLINKGAFLIQKTDDLLSLLPYKVDRAKVKEPVLSHKEKKILNIIPSDDIINFDNIIEKTKISIGELFQVLLKLELKGVIDKIQGNNYQRRKNL
jgi:DNA processing protein